MLTAIKGAWPVSPAHLISHKHKPFMFLWQHVLFQRLRSILIKSSHPFPSPLPYIISTWWFSYQWISESMDYVAINYFICKTVYASALSNSLLLKITACFAGISINTSDFIILPVNNQCGFCTIDHGDTYVSCTIGLNLPRNVLDECVECPFSRVKHLVLAPVFRPASCSAQKWNVLDLLG